MWSASFVVQIKIKRYSRIKYARHRKIVWRNCMLSIIFASCTTYDALAHNQMTPSGFHIFPKRKTNKYIIVLAQIRRRYKIWYTHVHVNNDEIEIFSSSIVCDSLFRRGIAFIVLPVLNRRRPAMHVFKGRLSSQPFRCAEWIGWEQNHQKSLHYYYRWHFGRCVALLNDYEK